MQKSWVKRYRLFFLLFLPILACGQGTTRQQDYINQFMRMAIDQMQKYKVPASITLAQGLLESGAGTSRLAREGNNHFGIKCGMSWNGPYMLVNDDAPNEHFRVYSSAEQSYEDHSLFLRQNRRYANLFNLRITDYKGWAHGLKAAGYATNPHYAYDLIQLIENYNLHKLDEAVYRNPRRIEQMELNDSRMEHPVYMCNQNFFTIAKAGDTFKSLAKEMGVSERKLRRYNEVGRKTVLQEGDVVYFQKKRTKADKSLKGIWHQVEPGESMHSIAQRYGLQMKTLYKNNFKQADYVPQTGDLLLLR